MQIQVSIISDVCSLARSLALSRARSLPLPRRSHTDTYAGAVCRRSMEPVVRHVCRSRCLSFRIPFFLPPAIVWQLPRQLPSSSPISNNPNPLPLPITLLANPNPHHRLAASPSTILRLQSRAAAASGAEQKSCRPTLGWVCKRAGKQRRRLKV